MTEVETNEIVVPEGAYQLALDVAREAGAILREKFGARRQVDFKGIVNLVTDADRASEAHISARLKAAFPGFRMIGEEGSTHDAAFSDSPYVWIFDPLDGTTNYAHAYPHFAVSIALRQHDTTLLGVVYNPMLDEMFAAELGKGATLNDKPMQVSTIDNLIESLLASGFSYNLKEREENLPIWADMLLTSQGPRRAGAAALDLAYVAAGRIDGYWEQSLEAWDMSSGGLLVEEAGGVVTNYTGGPFDPFGRQCVATNGHIHHLLIEAISKHWPPAR
ncbi:MAG: inositol monophosphatase [Thermomicrobiales bacterium]|nr:inositol monophosphatase [Thermomicrobiales bacterium]